MKTDRFLATVLFVRERVRETRLVPVLLGYLAAAQRLSTAAADREP